MSAIVLLTHYVQSSPHISSISMENVGLLGHEYFSPRSDSPALQAILIFEDAPLIYFRNYGIGQRRAGFSGDGPPASQGTTK